MENAQTNDPPAVSIVLPTYQRRELVGKAISSALSQTFRDFELIVVDDGSTDGTESAVKGLDSGFGMSGRRIAECRRRNTGINAARGAVVAFLDSDDHWLPEHLTVVTEVLNRHPEAILCTTSPRFVYGGRQSVTEATVVDALPSLFVENIVGAPASVAVRRQALLSVNGFDERLLVMEGWGLWLKLSVVGPFALLQRQTIVVQSIRGSLTERAARNGEYLRAIETIRTIVADLAGRVEHREDRELLRSRAAGLGAYLEALAAIARDDRELARTRLITACTGLPQLSTEPQLVANRLALLRFGPEARLHSYSAAAALWPDPRADTALYLRFHALVLALRLGHGKQALGLLGDWPLMATPRFLIRRASLFAQLARRTIQKRLHRGGESQVMPKTVKSDPTGP